jgi:hypothetical protein
VVKVKKIQRLICRNLVIAKNQLILFFGSIIIIITKKPYCVLQDPPSLLGKERWRNPLGKFGEEYSVDGRAHRKNWSKDATTNPYYGQ